MCSWIFNEEVLDIGVVLKMEMHSIPGYLKKACLMRDIGIINFKPGFGIVYRFLWDKNEQFDVFGSMIE